MVNGDHCDNSNCDFNFMTTTFFVTFNSNHNKYKDVFK